MSAWTACSLQGPNPMNHIQQTQKKNIQDKMIKIDKGKEFSELIKGSKIHIIKDCGHMVILENPFEMMEKIIEFLKKWKTFT